MLTTVVLWVAWSIPVAIAVGLVLRTREKGVAEEAEAYLRSLAGWNPAEVFSRIGFGAVALAGVVALAGASTMAAPGLPDVDVVSVTRSVRLAMGAEQSDFRPAEMTQYGKDMLEKARRDEGAGREKQTASDGGDSRVDDVGSSLLAGGGDTVVASGGPVGESKTTPDTPGRVTKDAKETRPVDTAAAASGPPEVKPTKPGKAVALRTVPSRPAIDVAPGPSEMTSPAASSAPPDPAPAPPVVAHVEAAPAPQPPPASTSTDTTVGRQVGRTSVQVTDQSVEVSATDTTTTQAG
jgi:hypothetical protein